MQEQVFTKDRPLSATIHRNKRRNVANEQIQSQSGAHMKVAQMERSGLVAPIELVEGSGMLQLEEALDGRVTQ